MKLSLMLALTSLFSMLLATTFDIPGDFSTIQSGIDAASHGDTVLVSPGVYTEGINYNGKNITVSSLYLTTQDTTYISNTVIDGNQEVLHVVEVSALQTQSTRLIGFTITGGLANGEELNDQRGGGIFMEGASPQIMFCHVTGNHADNCGGGASIVSGYNEDALVVNCWFANNTSSGAGGGLHYISTNGEGAISKSEFTDNTASEGGGLFYMGYGVDLEYCLFSNNTASAKGGGAYVYGDGMMYKCIYADNHASEGAAVVNDKNEVDLFTGFAIVNCTFADNIASNCGGSLYGMKGSATLLINNICYSNTPQEIAFSDSFQTNNLAIAYCDVENAEQGILTNNNANIEWMEGNTNADPLFSDPNAKDYSLLELSPCIDTATSYFTYAGNTFVDMDESEYIGSAPDMGALESNLSEVGGDDTPVVNLQFSTFPNPFNPEVTISFSFPTDSHTSVDVYNIRGQLIERLCDDNLEAGRHNLVWRAGKYASGVYLMRLRAAGIIQTRRVTLLK